MKKLSKEQLDHFVEKIRELNSSDCAYQHLLDTIAADVRKKFDEDWIYDRLNIIQITEFIKSWRP